MSRCKVCIEEYNDVKTIPVVGRCGHTVCLPCKKRMVRTGMDCPFCRMPSSFFGPSVNHEVLNIVAAKKRQMLSSVNENKAQNIIKTLIGNGKKNMNLEQKEEDENKNTDAAGTDRVEALLKSFLQRDQDIQKLKLTIQLRHMLTTMKQKKTSPIEIHSEKDSDKDYAGKKNNRPAIKNHIVKNQ